MHGSWIVIVHQADSTLDDDRSYTIPNPSIYHLRPTPGNVLYLTPPTVLNLDALEGWQILLLQTFRGPANPAMNSEPLTLVVCP